MTAVAPRSTSRSAAAPPPSTLKRVVSIQASTSSSPSRRRIASRNPAILRSTVVKRWGPTASPIRGVPELDEVPDGELHGGDVVVADERGVHAFDVAVDQDDRQPAAAQRLVAGRVGGGVGVQPGDEDDPGHPAFEQHLRVLVLVDAAGRLRAQHRRVALPGQRRLDDLREGREDRVLQLRHDEARRGPPSAA